MFFDFMNRIWQSTLTLQNDLDEDATMTKYKRLNGGENN